MWKVGFEPTRISPSRLKRLALTPRRLPRIDLRLESLDLFYSIVRVVESVSFFQTNPPANFSFPLTHAFKEEGATPVSLAA